MEIPCSPSISPSPEGRGQTCKCNVTSDWIGSRICDSIFCWRLDVMTNVACDWSKLWFYLTDTAYVWYEIPCFLPVKVKEKIIRMGITIFKFFTWGGMLLFIGSDMSRNVRKPDFCICENKDADQLCGNRTTDQRLCFRYTDSTIPLLRKSKISIFSNCVARFVLDLVGNPEDRFSDVAAHIMFYRKLLFTWLCCAVQSTGDCCGCCCS